MANSKKYFLTSAILIIIVFLTLHTIYDKESLKTICENINNINFYYILICFGIILLYFLLQGIYMKVILKALNYKISLNRGIFYSIVEFYFSGITPSSTGGQPVQLVYMTKDGIPIRKSYITLILNTIYFKLIMLLFGIFVLVFNNSYLFESALIYKTFFFIGFVVDALIVLLGALLLFKTSLIEFLYDKLIVFLRRFKLMKNKLNNTNEVMEKYKAEIEFIKTHKFLVFVTFILTLIQRIALFSIIYVIYRALGYNSLSYIELFCIQLTVQMAIEALPLPGGAGLSEGMLHNIFVVAFSEKMADSSMLLTRTFTFYLPLILSGLVIFLEYIIRKRKSELVCKK